MISKKRFALLCLTFLGVLALSVGRASAAVHSARQSTRAARTLRAARATRAVAIGTHAVSYARHLLGVPYVYGGSSPGNGFDCSGFVRFVYRHFGIWLPHSSYAQFDYGRRVSRAGLRPGDLVFFAGLGHVGLYIGGGRFIHAPHTGTRVSISSLADPWYRAEYDGARRLTQQGPS